MQEPDNQDIIVQYLEKDGEILKENGVVPMQPQQEQPQGSFKNHYWKFVGGFLVIVVLALVTVPFIGKYMDKQQAQTEEDQHVASRKAMQDLQDRLKNDKDGGATAEETLKLFITALKKWDIEQADKYFVFYPEKQQQRLISELKDIQEKGKLDLFIDYLGKAKYDNEVSSEGNVSFGYINRKDRTGIDIQIMQGKYSTIWKIEHLTF